MKTQAKDAVALAMDWLAQLRDEDSAEPPPGDGEPANSTGAPAAGDFGDVPPAAPPADWEDAVPAAPPAIDWGDARPTVPPADWGAAPAVPPAADPWPAVPPAADWEDARPAVPPAADFGKRRSGRRHLPLTPGRRCRPRSPGGCWSASACRHRSRARRRAARDHVGRPDRDKGRDRDYRAGGDRRRAADTPRLVRDGLLHIALRGPGGARRGGHPQPCYRVWVAGRCPRPAGLPAMPAG